MATIFLARLTYHEETWKYTNLWIMQILKKNNKWQHCVRCVYYLSEIMTHTSNLKKYHTHMYSLTPNAFTVYSEITWSKVLEGREEPTRGPARSLMRRTRRMLQRKMRLSTMDAHTGIIRTVVYGLSLIQHLQVNKLKIVWTVVVY